MKKRKRIIKEETKTIPLFEAIPKRDNEDGSKIYGYKKYCRYLKKKKE